MKRTSLSLAVLSLAAATSMPLVAHAQDASPWLIRARAVYLDSANKDSTGLDLSIDNKWIPEVDVSYFFSPNFAVELILTYPQKHDIRAGGNRIGSLKHLPPTLLAQYHFTDFGAFKPYVGAGLNYTRVSSVNFDSAVEAALGPSVEKSSIGLAAQIGFDYEIQKNVYVNVDIKKVKLGVDVKSFGNKVGELKLDPWLFGVGIGYRF